MEDIYLCEPSYLERYLYKIENATESEINMANDEFGNKKQNEILSIEGDTAFIEINGSLSKNGPSPIARFFGFQGTGFDQIMEAIELVKDDISIKDVIFKMDTPGGTVPGTDEAFQTLQALSKIKNTVAQNHGMIASGGLFFASGARKIIAMAPTTETGSLGVMIAGIDDTEFLKNEGFKRITIRSSNAPNKNPDIATKKGQDILQQRVNDLEKIFIQRVAEGRGVTEAKVKKDFGRGGLLIAEDALDAGMIDDIITSVKNNKENEIVLQEQNKMNLTEMIEKHPELKNEIAAMQTSFFQSGAEKQKEIFKVQAGKISAFLKKDTVYPETIVNKAIGFLMGENTIEVLEASAAAYDAVMEANNSAAAAGEGADDTPPEGGAAAVSEDGVIRSQTDIDANVAKLKLVRGMS